MVVPLTWDEEGVTECAFVTRAFWRGRAVDQVQLHLKGTGGAFFSPGEYAEKGSLAAGSSRPGSSPLESGGIEGTYRIVTACFDRDGNRVEPEGVCPVYDTGSPWPTFALVKPAIDNTRVDMSPYGQSVFADAVDAIQAVDLCYDAMMSEIDNGKMRVFLSDVMFDVERDGKGGRVSIPFGKGDCTVFRKVMSTEDTIHEFAPALRTEDQARAFRVALQTLGDLCGFGLDYFDLDKTGYLRTATEVSADNSALMRNIRRHERALEAPSRGSAGRCWRRSAGSGSRCPTKVWCASRSTTASSRTRPPRNARTWTRSPPGSWSRGSTAASGTARTRQRPAGAPPGRAPATPGAGEPDSPAPGPAAKTRPERGAAVRLPSARTTAARTPRARDGAEAGGLRTTLDDERAVVGCGPFVVCRGLERGPARAERPA